MQYKDTATMKEEDIIKARYGTAGPWKVPDGYFEAVRVEVTAKLPAYPAKPGPVRLSRWQRVQRDSLTGPGFAG